MNDKFTKNIQGALGEKGVIWLDSLPSLIKTLEDKWSIKVGQPFNLTYNYVAPATRADGTEVVLKIRFPNPVEAREEIEALKLYNGEGISKLYEVDEENLAFLMERVLPGVPLSKLDNDEKATFIICSTLKKLWREVPDGYPARNISDWAKGFDRIKTKFNGTYGPLPKDLCDESYEIMKELIATSREQVLCHADLHHDNILTSTRDEWLAIDPQGIIAEKAFDTARMLDNPEDLKKRPNLKNILETRINQMSDELSLSRDRIYKWGVSFTVLSMIWTVEDGGDRWKDSLEFIDVLKAVNL